MFNTTSIKDVKISLGKLTKILRERNDLSQEQLGEKLGLSRLTIQNLEGGKNPTLETILKVLQYFGLLENVNASILSEISNHNKESLY